MADEGYLGFDDNLLCLLTMAAAEGFTDMAETLIIYGVADVNRVGSEYDYSPFHTAMLNNHPSIVSLLLECADLDLVSVRFGDYNRLIFSPLSQFYRGGVVICIQVGM